MMPDSRHLTEKENSWVWYQQACSPCSTSHHHQRGNQAQTNQPGKRPVTKEKQNV